MTYCHFEYLSSSPAKWQVVFFDLLDVKVSTTCSKTEKHLASKTPAVDIGS